MPKKILIVDDDELTVRLLSSRLRDSGYQIVVAKDGAIAFDQVVNERPDAVIMDIMLPDMQGSDTVRLFQDNPHIPDDLQVIFLSGIISQEDTPSQKVQVGGRYYAAVSKPVDFNQLLALLSEGKS